MWFLSRSLKKYLIIKRKYLLNEFGFNNSSVFSILYYHYCNFEINLLIIFIMCNLKGITVYENLEFMIFLSFFSVSCGLISIYWRFLFNRVLRKKNNFLQKIIFFLDFIILIIMASVITYQIKEIRAIITIILALGMVIVRLITGSI